MPGLCRIEHSGLGGSGVEIGSFKIKGLGFRGGWCRCGFRVKGLGFRVLRLGFHGVDVNGVDRFSRVEGSV